MIDLDRFFDIKRVCKLSGEIPNGLVLKFDSLKVKLPDVANGLIVKKAQLDDRFRKFKARSLSEGT